MTLLAGGDSFVWGSELSDHKHGGPLGYSNSTFAALLSNNDYICTAYPGIGNVEIVTRVLRQINQNHRVLVCWTWPSRDGKLDSDAEIINLQHYLNVNRIPYMFTCADNCVVTRNPKIDYTKWFMFPPGKGPAKTGDARGFYQWAVEEGYECGSDHHPLEQAHADAAALMRFQFLQLCA